MKVKLSDLAKELDISVAAVSMALNNKKGVSDETRERVLDLANEKGYKIKVIHDESINEPLNRKYIKLLRIQKHGLVAMDTAFFSRIIEGIEAECSLNNYELLVASCRLSELEDILLKNENDHDVEGLIVLATELNVEDVSLFDFVKVPFVMLDSYFIGKEWDFVLINNASASYEAVKYLRQCGHQQIGYLKSNTWIYNFERRYRSYQEALGQFGLDYNEAYTYSLEPTLNGAYENMLSFLEAHTCDSFPTALVADNDIIAAGAMNAMKDYGVVIPERISIIGIDDMPFAQMLHPRLTTSKVYKKEIGRESVRTLLSKLKNETKVTKKRMVNTQLVIRDSVKNIHMND